ncbi:hypothetical protein N658DRAFT_527479 [Parathielavia hyrcaniae]|uniref:MYND-type domain-containing protein n=1 Tax=Parathielavia hyrcaniae TaxID=113614 RepID=A0AAN6SWV4_9PEZI|nr:hypothetical protein N658DRAFT_527479 [Parathielavia hyrcaniae]
MSQAAFFDTLNRSRVRQLVVPPDSLRLLDAVNLLLCSRCRKTRYCTPGCQAAAWPSHKRTCRRPNCILKFHLHPERITDPPVVRTLSCPADMPFVLLHMALQIAFGYAATHSFDFAVKDPAYALPDDPFETVMRQSMMLMGKDIRTAVGNDESMPREYILRVVDPVSEQGMAVNEVHEPRRRHPRTVEKSSAKWDLWKLFDNPEYQGNEVVYTYDFGDDWEHRITFEGRADPTTYYACLSGTGHPVAEDVGGVNGWEALKAAYRTAQPDKEQREKREWFEKDARNTDPAGLTGYRFMCGTWTG